MGWWMIVDREGKRRVVGREMETGQRVVLGELEEWVEGRAVVVI